MVMKLVLKVNDLHDPKSKRKALKTVSSIEGVDSLAVDKEKKTLTVKVVLKAYDLIIPNQAGRAMKAVSKLEGVESMKVDREKKTVTVIGNNRSIRSCVQVEEADGCSYRVRWTKQGRE
ncbi:hypothetical protein MLD38_018483 [Melastoma candidum]|uniref:Uncharacterized protein n=1 Tax=Melastoma candidum TaxID=119954 RepID=A0ACB9R284_9MYRT|nr:hypothetical protein MLD38_018483 [Melastoma candidum]